MKQKYLFASLLCAVGGLFATDWVEKEEKLVTAPLQQPLSGSDLVEKVRKDLTLGKHQEFLEEQERDVRQAFENAEISDLISMREEVVLDSDLQQVVAQWEASHLKLIQERNSKLLSLSQGQGNSLMTKRISSAIYQLSDEEREAIRYLSSLRMKTPEQAANADERVLINLDIASEFKALHVDSLYAAKPFENLAEKQLALKLDSLQRMQEVAKTFTDVKLRQKVEVASLVFDAWQARSLDLAALHSMAKKPTNDAERQVATILSDYQFQKESLYQKEFLTKLDKK